MTKHNYCKTFYKIHHEIRGRVLATFLDCLLKRESDGMLTSTVYKKPTHTDRYFHFKSHHPNHVKRGVVRCLYQRARRVTNMGDNLKEKEKHLHKVLHYDNDLLKITQILSKRNV